MSNLADRIPEPPDGTRLVYKDRHGRYCTVWRNDEEGRRSRHEEERWFEGASYGEWGEPLSWQQALKFAKAVYSVSTAPLVEK